MSEIISATVGGACSVEAWSSHVLSSFLCVGVYFKYGLVMS